MTSADEDGHGPSSFSAGEPTYFNPSSSSNASTAAQHDENKATKSDKGSSSGGKATAAAKAQQPTSGGGWFGGIFSKLKPKNQMKLPDDKNPTVYFSFFSLFAQKPGMNNMICWLQIVWDPTKNRWIDTSKDDEDEAASLPPPPKDASFQSLPSMPATPSFASPVPAANNEGNRFGLNKG